LEKITKESIIKQLRGRGLKVTPQRVAIIEVLIEKRDSHPGARLVYEEARKKKKSVSLKPTALQTGSRVSFWGGWWFIFKIDQGMSVPMRGEICSAFGKITGPKCLYRSKFIGINGTGPCHIDLDIGKVRNEFVLLPRSYDVANILVCNSVLIKFVVL
jgi:hypothetical protein